MEAELALKCSISTPHHPYPPIFLILLPAHRSLTGKLFYIISIVTIHLESRHCHQFVLFPLKQAMTTKQKMDWRDGSVVKICYCSCRTGVQLTVLTSTSNSSSRGSKSFWPPWLLGMHTVHINLHAGKICTQKNKTKGFF